MSKRKKSLVGWTRPAVFPEFRFRRSGRPMPLYVPPILKTNTLWLKLKTESIKVRITIEELGGSNGK